MNRKDNGERPGTGGGVSLALQTPQPAVIYWRWAERRDTTIVVDRRGVGMAPLIGAGLIGAGVALLLRALTG